jgi:hypothetical protein
MRHGNHNAIVQEAVIGILLGIPGIIKSLGGNKSIVAQIHLKYIQKLPLGRLQVQLVNRIV